MTVGEASEMERAHLLPLAEERFPIDEILFPLIVDGKGRVKVKTNWYSAPLWPGLRVTARVWPSLVEILHDGECVARHQRNYGRGHQILESGTLSGRVGEEAGRDGRIDAAGAMATGRTLAGVSGPNLEETGRTPRQKRRNQRDDRAGPRRTRQWMGSADRCGGRSAATWRHRCGGGDAHLRMPDAEERRRYQIALSEELAQFERPQPVMDEYDLLLS